MKEDLLICQCEDVEHQLIFRYNTEDRDVYMSVHLCKLPLWKRIKHAIKYIFGHRCRYGDFDEFIFKKEDVNKLENIVKFLK